MKQGRVSLLEVQARWGYSESIESQLSSHYADLSDLRVKRSSGVSFEQLSEAEQYELAFRNACLRPILQVYLTGVVSFDVVEIDRPKLATMFVPPNVWYPESAGRFIRFEEYMGTASSDPADARNVLPQHSSYQYPIDPITFGRSFTYPIMIDGYHRAAGFWKYGPRDGKLLAYMPDVLEWARIHDGNHPDDKGVHRSGGRSAEQSSIGGCQLS